MVRNCGEHGFNRSDDEGQVYYFTPESVPVDAHPWLFVGCTEELRDCHLIADGDVVAVDIDRMNDCDASLCDLVEFTPRERLQPAKQYALICDGFGGAAGPFITTRDDESPSAPPGEVMVNGANNEDGLGLSFAPYSLSAPYLRDGGRIEVAYPDGGVLPITSAYTGYQLPTSSGPLVLTPVAADGQRGDAVTVEPTGTSGCEISPERSSSVWLLLSLMSVRRRRRPSRR